METSHVNVVFLCGTLARDSEMRVLPSGSAVANYELTTRVGGASTTVPVVCPDGPSLPAGAEVVVCGQIKRRFFRSGGTTQSRTEVAADTVTRASSRKRVDRALQTARSALGA